VATLAVFFANGLGLGAWAAAIPALKARLALSDGQSLPREKIGKRVGQLGNTLMIRVGRALSVWLRMS
jgi:hypothetical protein